MAEFDPQPDRDERLAERAVLDSAALSLPADRRIVDRLFHAGVLDDRGRQEALRMLSGPVVWWPWIDRALLFLGLTLALVGVVCFFAWNWVDLPGIAKLGIVQLGIVACCGVALWKGLETAIGKAAQIGASVLVGVFLAVFGQIYQTGADEWLLFAGWSGLILPWTIVARFDALWILWLSIVNVALSLCWEQTFSAAFDWEFLMMTLGLVNGAALGLRELGEQRGLDWLQHRWPRHLLVAATLTPLICPVLVQIVDDGFFGDITWLATVVFAGVLCVTHLYFRHRSPDLFALTCTVTCVCVVVTFLIGKVLVEAIQDGIVLVLIGGVIIGVVTVAAMWLMRVAREIRWTDNGEAEE